MNITIKRAVLKRMKIKYLVAGQSFVLSEDSNHVLMKINIRSGNDNQPLSTVPTGKCLIVGLKSGYAELVDEGLEVLPVEASLSGQVMTL